MDTKRKSIPKGKGYDPILTPGPNVDASGILTMYLMAENLVNVWDVIKDEFKKTKTLKDKRLLSAMMYQPWELCDNTFTEWSAANKITLPAKHTLRTVVAKYLYSD